jgi:hypothetical protein
MVLGGWYGLGSLPPIQNDLERPLGLAVLDAELAQRLLRDPASTALAFGASAVEAALIRDIRVPDLESFARDMSSRLYGGPDGGEKQLRLVANS